MSWHQLRCRSGLDDQTSLDNFLTQVGALSVTYQDAEDDPIYEPLPGETPLWQQLVITALFDIDVDMDTVRLALTQLEGLNHPVSDIDIEHIADQAWERAWMKDFKPMQFGHNLWIYPTWCDRPDDGSTQIILDPGLAFGTGTHETTALCLEWLDKNPPLNKEVIDYGCGSGILAIAAIKLGAKHAVATDIDEQALIATQNNRETNHLAKQTIHTCYPDQLSDTPVDVVMANILSGPLLELAPELAKRCKAQGQIILSGILREQEEAILNGYKVWFDQLTVSYKEDWISVSGIRKIT